jgi:hypothetical protein
MVEKALLDICGRDVAIVIVHKGRRVEFRYGALAFSRLAATSPRAAVTCFLGRRDASRLT